MLDGTIPIETKSVTLLSQHSKLGRFANFRNSGITHHTELSLPDKTIQKVLIWSREVHSYKQMYLLVTWEGIQCCVIIRYLGYGETFQAKMKVYKIYFLKKTSEVKGKTILYNITVYVQKNADYNLGIQLCFLLQGILGEGYVQCHFPCYVSLKSLSAYNRLMQFRVQHKFRAGDTVTCMTLITICRQ